MLMAWKPITATARKDIKTPILFLVLGSTFNCVSEVSHCFCLAQNKKHEIRYSEQVKLCSRAALDFAARVGS